MMVYVYCWVCVTLAVFCIIGYLFVDGMARQLAMPSAIYILSILGLYHRLQHHMRLLAQLPSPGDVSARQPCIFHGSRGGVVPSNANKSERLCRVRRKWALLASWTNRGQP